MDHDPQEDQPSDIPDLFAEPGAHAPPAELDYELVRLIGRGAYGEVWLVRDRAGDYFACKVVYRESFGNARPYEREYQGIQKFEPVSQSSESQVKILHVGRRDEAGYFYYIMELADDVQTGATMDPSTYVPKTLRSEIEDRKKLPVSECIRIGLSLTAALDNLHRHGLIHRDIKPANIIFVRGVPKLADIGLVTDLDVTISYVGTEGFIPPEGPKSAQADIFGLGKVLYEIATGKDRLDFPELPENFSEFPDWENLLELNAIIIKACETDPRKRYATAKEFHDDLALLNTGKSVRQARATQRKKKLLLYCCVVAAALGIALALAFPLVKHLSKRTSTTSIPGAATKIPWPAAHDIAVNEARLKDTYNSQLTAGTGPARQQAALELLEHSTTSGDSAVEAASLRVAGLLAADADDITLAMAICAKMETRFELNVLPQKVEMLDQASGHTHSPTSKTDLTQGCLETGFTAIAADDYASADSLADMAIRSAIGANDLTLSQQASFLRNEVTRCHDAYDRIAEDWKTFRDKPSDPHASLAVGRFLCFIKNDWANGLPLIARGNDEALKAVVNTEVNGALKDSRGQLSLGGAWWELATGAQEPNKMFYQRRARYWYLKGIASADDANKSDLRQRLSSRINAVPVDAGVVHIVSRVGGSESVDIYGDKVEWNSGRRGTTGNKINYVNLGDFKAGGLDVVNNSGATRLMPDTVDFSTAHLAIDRNPRRQGGQASLQIADDHVRVVLAHQRVGASEIEVTVNFEKRP